MRIDYFNIIHTLILSCKLTDNTNVVKLLIRQRRILQNIKYLKGERFNEKRIRRVQKMEINHK